MKVFVDGGKGIGYLPLLKLHFLAAGWRASGWQAAGKQPPGGLAVTGPRTSLPLHKAPIAQASPCFQFSVSICRFRFGSVQLASQLLFFGLRLGSSARGAPAQIPVCGSRFQIPVSGFQCPVMFQVSGSSLDLLGWFLDF